MTTFKTPTKPPAFDRRDFCQTYTELHPETQLTVYETVLMGRRPHVQWSLHDGDYALVEQVLDQLGLNQLAMRPINSLSGGQLQKVIIARALAQSPSVLLLDEPISNLDLKNQIDVMQLVQGVTRAEKLAAVVTIHDLNMALRFGDKFLFLKDQKVQAITDRYGPSYKAFLIVPMVGAFFVDLVNAAILQMFTQLPFLQ